MFSHVEKEVSDSKYPEKCVWKHRVMKKHDLSSEQTSIAKDECTVDTEEKFGLGRWATATVAWWAMLNNLDYIPQKTVKYQKTFKSYFMECIQFI